MTAPLPSDFPSAAAEPAPTEAGPSTVERLAAAIDTAVPASREAMTVAVHLPVGDRRDQVEAAVRLLGHEAAPCDPTGSADHLARILAQVAPDVIVTAEEDLRYPHCPVLFLPESLDTATLPAVTPDRSALWAERRNRPGGRLAATA